MTPCNCKGAPGSSDAFDNAALYDCRDGAEQLNHESVEEAIEAEVERHCSLDCDVAKVIASMGELTVTAYVREEVTPIWIHDQCDRMVESLAEAFSEDFGDMDGDGEDMSNEACAALASAIEPIVRAALSKVHVWRCRDVGTRTYDDDEVLAMMREHRPDWFESDAAVPR